jgi:hypothetical protein
MIKTSLSTLCKTHALRLYSNSILVRSLSNEIAVKTELRLSVRLELLRLSRASQRRWGLGVHISNVLSGRPTWRGKPVGHPPDIDAVKVST